MINNAVDAVEGKVDGEIAIATKNQPDSIVITIADNGKGIAKALQQQIFDPFFTTKPVGEGTGMGLAISYQIVVDQHGGELTCQSVLGQGSQFQIVLPKTLEVQALPKRLAKVSKG